MQDLSDQSLVVRCINGERLAWDKFIERFSQLIYWAIKKRLNRTNYRYNQQDIEDIFQNTFVLLWEKEKLRQIKNRENVSGWLAMVTANCAVNHFRNKREEFISKEELIPEEIQSSDCSAPANINQIKLRDILEEVLNFLSPRERIILKLNYLYDKTHREIGQILKMPESSVSSVIKRAREKLKGKLKKQDGKNF